MRLIGHLESETLALRISGLLVAQGIHHQIEEDDGPRWALWVMAEDDLERARTLLAGFRANPDDPAYRLRALPAGETAATSARRADLRSSSEPGPRRRRGPAASRTLGGPPVVAGSIMVLCLLVAFVTRLDGDHPLVQQMQISEVRFRWGGTWELFLPEVRRGQVWRLLTPAFLHFSVPHILFNLWMFWDLGRAVEFRRGTRTLLALVVGLGVASNLGQYLMSGPWFGGMSGVVYGLLGYAWMMGRFRPSAGLGLHPQTVVIMLVWFLICLVGAVGVPVANTAHGVGLLAGMLWGWMEARWGGDE